jgi:hypothetical protein
MRKCGVSEKVVRNMEERVYKSMKNDKVRPVK